MKQVLVSPSILSADLGNLAKDIEMVNNSDADWIHVDIMDGMFVPNISFGIPIVAAAKKVAKKPLDVHLMIENPDKYIDAFKNAGADILVVHQEACTHLHRTLQAIKAAGMKAGVALNPATPVHLLEDIITEVDVLLIMTVNPGFGGQKFIEHSYDKVRKAKDIITKAGANTLIEVDGGVNFNNNIKLVNAGVDVLVAGNTVFASENPTKTIAKLKTI